MIYESVKLEYVIYNTYFNNQIVCIFINIMINLYYKFNTFKSL